MSENLIFIRKRREWNIAAAKAKSIPYGEGYKGAYESNKPPPPASVTAPKPPPKPQPVPAMRSYVAEILVRNIKTGETEPAYVVRVFENGSWHDGKAYLWKPAALAEWAKLNGNGRQVGSRRSHPQGVKIEFNHRRHESGVDLGAGVVMTGNRRHVKLT